MAIIEVEATYEDGVLKLDDPLPLKEHERVTVRVEPRTSRIDENYGLIGWTGGIEVLRKVAEEDEFSVAESP